MCIWWTTFLYSIFISIGHSLVMNHYVNGNKFSQSFFNTQFQYIWTMKCVRFYSFISFILGVLSLSIFHFILCRLMLSPAIFVSMYNAFTILTVFRLFRARFFECKVYQATNANVHTMWVRTAGCTMCVRALSFDVIMWCRIDTVDASMNKLSYWLSCFRHFM